MTSLRILWKDSQGTINRNDIKSLGTNSDPYITAIFPNQIWEKTLPIEASLLDSAKKREASMFIGVLINYKYANNRSGEYGIIFRYGTILPKFVGKIIQINHICILVNLREPAIELKNILLISLNYVSLYYRDSQMPSELPESKLSKMSYGEISYPKL